MTFDEFKRKIDNCKSGLEYADESDIKNTLSRLSDLIELGKIEGHVSDLKYQTIINEIEDANKPDRKVKSGLSKKDVKDRLKYITSGLIVELNSIVKSS